MDIKEFATQAGRKARELDDLLRRRMPVVAGRMAQDHFQDNFRRGGFVNGGLHPWPVTRRQRSGSKLASANYGPLLSRRNHLFRSVKYVPGAYRVRVANDLPYAPLHNWGGETHPAVTDRMRRFAWARFYQSAGIRKGMSGKQKAARLRKAGADPQAQMWKRLALTRKSRLTVRVPQRQFLGESRELTEKIARRVETDIRNILNS